MCTGAGAQTRCPHWMGSRYQLKQNQRDLYHPPTGSSRAGPPIVDTRTFPATLVRRLGHDRWKQENNGWNDLTQNWAFKHGFSARLPAPLPNAFRGRRSQICCQTRDWLLSLSSCCWHSRSARHLFIATRKSFAAIRSTPLRWPGNSVLHSPNFRRAFARPTRPQRHSLPPDHRFPPDLVRTGISSHCLCCRLRTQPPSHRFSPDFRGKIRAANLPDILPLPSCEFSDQAGAKN